jgi:hypothetical protein
MMPEIAFSNLNSASSSVDNVLGETRNVSPIRALVSPDPNEAQGF